MTDLHCSPYNHTHTLTFFGRLVFRFCLSSVFGFRVSIRAGQALWPTFDRLGIALLRLLCWSSLGQIVQTKLRISLLISKLTNFDCSTKLSQLELFGLFT